MRGTPALREEVATLRREVRALRMARAEPRASLPEALRRRGILLGRAGAPEGLLFPPTLSGARQRRLYEQLKWYSFRLFLRDLISHQETLRPETLTRFCSPEAAARYFRFLEGCGIVRRGRGGAIRLKQVAASLTRVHELMPNLAVFLVDTELRMQDKLVGLF